MADEVIQPQRQAEPQTFDEFRGLDQAIADQRVINDSTDAELAALGIQSSTVDAIPVDDSSSLTGLSAPLTQTRSAGTAADAQNLSTSADWRVRLTLAKKADYLYLSETPGILRPLIKTGGIVFPYTPTIQITYAAHYDGTELTHSNYKIFQYKSSSVDSIQITCDFTAQDTNEANYLLAVIHFFRAATKMFYGKDTAPKAGTPPPLCYLTGLGQFQFNNHPLVINSFTYSLPNDVDYIRASSFPGTSPGEPTSGGGIGYSGEPTEIRPRANGVPVSGLAPPAAYVTRGNESGGTTEPTYVPTKIQLSIMAYPIITRNDISNEFSFKKYASGALLNRSSGGGIW